MKKTAVELREIVKDNTLPKAKRIEAALEIKEQLLNPLPVKDFDPDTFEPNQDEMVKVIPRSRKHPERRLPNPHKLKPKEIMEGQMVGMYENKQDLYLLIAWLSERLTDLEDEVELLKPKK